MSKRKVSIERMYNKKKYTNKPTIFSINKECWDLYSFDEENELRIGDLVLSSDYRLAYILDFNYDYGKKNAELRYIFRIKNTDNLFEKAEVSNLKLINRKEHSRVMYKVLDYFEEDFFIYTEWIELINGKYSKNKLFGSFSTVDFIETNKKGKICDLKYARTFRLKETVDRFSIYSSLLYTGYKQEEERMYYIHDKVTDTYYYGGMEYELQNIISILKSNILRGKITEKMRIS